MVVMLLFSEGQCVWTECKCDDLLCALIFASQASSGKNMLKAAGMEAAVSIVRKRNVFTWALEMSHKTL